MREKSQKSFLIQFDSENVSEAFSELSLATRARSDLSPRRRVWPPVSSVRCSLFRLDETSILNPQTEVYQRPNKKSSGNRRERVLSRMAQPPHTHLLFVPTVQNF